MEMKVCCALIWLIYHAFFIKESYSRSKNGPVIKLSSANFESLVAEGDWMIEFYAPWCGHCRQLEPTYRKVAEDLAGQVNVAKIDATEERALAARFHVTGYPSIFFVRGSDVREYHGGRSEKQLKEFALGGWKSFDKVGFLKSPFSLMGRTKGQLISGGLKVLGLHTYFVEELQFHWALSCGLLVLAGLILTFWTILGCMWLYAPKEKHD